MHMPAATANLLEWGKARRSKWVKPKLASVPSDDKAIRVGEDMGLWKWNEWCAAEEEWPCAKRCEGRKEEGYGSSHMLLLQSGHN